MLDCDMLDWTCWTVSEKDHVVPLTAFIGTCWTVTCWTVSEKDHVVPLTAFIGTCWTATCWTVTCWTGHAGL